MRWYVTTLLALIFISPYGFAEGKEKRTRARNLSVDGTIRQVGDRTKIDFESADISGARKTPMGAMVNQNKSDKDYDFVKIRRSWHPEMINSAASLDVGR